MLKSYGVGWGGVGWWGGGVVVAYEILVLALGPLVFGFRVLWAKGFGAWA